MRWLNYHHLLYFWTVVRTGSIAAASKELFLSQPAISTQLKSLENAVGGKLLVRSGNRLELTETGKLVFEYAEQIFRLGGELRALLALKDESRRLRVGLGQMFPKLLADQLLQPAWSGSPRFALECREASAEVLLTALKDRELDLVLLDDQVSESVAAPFRCDVMLEAELGLFSSRTDHGLAERYPKSLADAAIVAPPLHGELWRELSQWLEGEDVKLRPVAECDDGAMVVTLARSMGALFLAPLAAADQLERRDGCALVGKLPHVRVSIRGYSHRGAAVHDGVRALLAACPFRTGVATG